jgi:diguanylate cyclase
MPATSAPNHTTTAITAVARETLRRIATEHLSPTPETYTRVYAEIAATHPEHPRQPQGQDGRVGATIIGRLLTQLEVPHVGITVTRKREGLKRALVPRLESLEALYARLNRLMDSWNGPNAETGNHVSAFLGTDILGSSTEHEHAASAIGSLGHHGATEPHGRTIVGMRTAQPANEIPESVISFRLAGLLALLLKNINELTPESALVASQIEQIGRVLTAPLTEKKLDEAERCIRALVVRQSAIKHSITETKRAIRELAEMLIDKMSTLVTSTDSYATKVVDIAEQIASTNDLGQLSDLTRTLLSDARALSANVGAERVLLVEAQERAKALEVRTTALEGELREASTLVRTDPLTRALNRRGFTEAYKTELAKTRGGDLPSVALIDVDNFKLVNERFGHSVGDDVLCCVVEVLQRSAGTSATVARYGGEEFALLFPGGSADQAELVLVKMQRALHEHLAHDAPNLPAVTFSAGVAQVEVQETLPDVITRADRALREAKAAGKNCVVVASARVPAAL